MEVFLLIIGFIFIILGLIGCILPVLPGPLISYLGLLIQQLQPGENPFSWKFLGVWALITVFVTILDLVIPAFGTKLYQGSRQGVYGSVAGLLIGLFFFPPLGIIIGPFIGAYLGELASGKNAAKALKSGLGSFLGFLTGTAAKIVVSGLLTYHFVKTML